jgi:hypothetical protein
MQKDIMYMIIIGVKEKALANTVPAALPTLCADKKHKQLMILMSTNKNMLSSFDQKCNIDLLAERISEQLLLLIYYKNNNLRRFSI